MFSSCDKVQDEVFGGYLNGIIDKNLVLSPYEGVLYDGRCGFWLCYVFTDNTKDSNGNWFYWDCIVAYYRLCSTI